MPIPPQFVKDNPGITAAMSMPRTKHKKKKPTKKDTGLQDAAARKLAKLKGKSNGPNANQ